jgi:hypothetical protein
VPPLRIAGFLAALTCPLALASCSSSSPSAAQLLASTKTAVTNASAVHYVDVTTVNGTTNSESVSGSLSATQALATLVVNKTPTLQVVLAGTTLYLQTTSTAVLEKNLGLSAAQATSAVSKWISITPSDSAYNTVLSSISIASEVSGFYPDPAKATIGSTRTVHGISVTPLTSVTTSSGTTQETTLFVDPKTSLPVGGTIVGTKGKVKEQKVGAFTRWNKSFTVTPPSGAVPLSSLLAG